MSISEPSAMRAASFAAVLKALGFNYVTQFDHVNVVCVKVENINYYINSDYAINYGTEFAIISIINSNDDIKINFRTEDNRDRQIVLERYYVNIHGRYFKWYIRSNVEIIGCLVNNMYLSFINAWVNGFTVLDMNFMPVTAQKTDILNEGFKYITFLEINCILNNMTIIDDKIADGEFTMYNTAEDTQDTQDTQVNEIPNKFKYYNKNYQNESFVLLTTGREAELASGKRTIKLTNIFDCLLKKQHGGLYGGYIIKTKLTMGFMRTLIDRFIPNGKSVVIEDFDYTYEIFQYNFGIYAKLTSGKIVELDVCAPNSGMRTKAAAQSE